jgi:hypothetical protein
MSAVGREVGSHNGWSEDLSKDRPTSLLLYLQIIIKKDYVVFIILYVKKLDYTYALFVFLLNHSPKFPMFCLAHF